MTSAAAHRSPQKKALTFSPAFKLMYSVGEIANSIKVVTFGIYSLFFATSVKGLPGAWIGVVGFLAMFWDAIIDPYVGYLTDGAKAQVRRYRFMLVGALTMGIGFFAFFSPPRNLSTMALFLWLLSASLVVRSATSMFSIPYYAVGANLSRDYHERTSITAARGIAATLGTLLTAALSFVLFFPEKTPGIDPKLNPEGYFAMGLAFGCVMSIVALIALRTARPLESRAIANEEAPQAPGEFFRSVRESLRHRSFRVLLISSALGMLALTVNSSMLLYFLKYYVEINASKILSASQAIFFGGGIIGTLFWLRLSKHFEKHRLYALSAAVTGALLLAASLLFGKGHPLGTGNTVPLLIAYGVTGFFNCVLWFMPQSMVADVADELEWLSGRRREGGLFGILSFFQQLATGAGIMLSGALLEYFVGLVPAAAQQSSTTVVRIGVVTCILPAIIFAAIAMLMRGYQLTGSKLSQIQQSVAATRRATEVTNTSIG